MPKKQSTSPPKEKTSTDESTVVSNHWTDSNGNPAGGSSYGRGFAISWQNGPLGRGPDRQPANGAFVEDVLRAVVSRIAFYQASRFACAQNAEALAQLRAALTQLRAALMLLEARTADRKARQVEGTHAL